MNQSWQNFLNQPPEQVVTWQDNESLAKGWLVINSLRGGAAGGGTRIHSGCTKDEVVELAKTMEIKFAISGPAIGGAKSGIDYDFKDEADKQAVLARWFRFIRTHLQNNYGTGGDQNVDQLRDVWPLLRNLRMKHPQEGIVRGHYAMLSRAEQNKRMARLRAGTRLAVEQDHFLHSLGLTVSDVSTGYGVVEAVEQLLVYSGEPLRGKRVVVEGFGQVGRSVAYYAWRAGARVVGIIEKNWHLFDEHGLNVPGLWRSCRVEQLFCQEGQLQHQELGRVAGLPPADIFIPAAISHTITHERFEVLQKSGIRIIACAANNPFSDAATAERADFQFTVIPDFIANAGMARVFAYFMQRESVLNEAVVFKDIRECLRSALRDVLRMSNSLVGLGGRAYQLTLERLTE